MSCRVTVVGARRRLDAYLPDSIPVVELLADVAGLLGEDVNGAAVDWGLLKVGGARLDPELSLADQGVADGAMLFLRDVTSAPPAPAIDDFAGQVAVIVDAQRGRWQAATTPVLLAWIAAGSLAIAGLVVLAAGDASGRAVGGVFGAAVSGLAAFVLVRVAGRPALAVIVGFAGLPLWIAAGAGIAGLLGAGPPTAAGFGLAGATIGSLATFAIAGDRAFTAMNGVAEATALPAIVLVVAAAAGGGSLDAAAVLVVVELAMLATLPLAAARMASSMPAEYAEVTRRFNRGRRAIYSSRLASAAVIVVSCAVLATSGSWFAWGLVGATATATALRARHYRFAGEVVPLLAAGIGSLFLLELPLAVWLAIGIRGAAGLALLLIADAIVLVGVVVLVRRWSLSPPLVRWLRPAEFAAVATTVPLALGVLGLYDAVAHFVRGLG